MKIAVIGRSELLYNCVTLLIKEGHHISCILTAKEAPEYTVSADDFRALANKLNIPFEITGKITNSSSFLQESNSDLAISINYTGIIPSSIIDIFPLGILNAHGGDLPKYRGNACQAWAIINGEDKIGLCVHKMIGGELDSGDIITRDYFLIDSKTNITQVWEWMSRRTPELMVDAALLLSTQANYILERQSKDQRDALRCYPRKPEDGRIDWNQPSVVIMRLINASNKPYAGAFCNYEGEKIIIWDAEVVEDDELFCAVPGQVLNIDRDTVDVACSVGKIRLHQVQLGSQVSRPSSIINSIRKRLI